MNILSVYFSGTNNTKHINDIIKENVNKDNKFDEIRVTCDIDVSSFVFSSYDLLIIGCPIYVGVYPKAFTKFIYENFKDLSNKNVIIYQTSGSANPPGIYEINQFFEEKNNVIGLLSFYMPNNFYMNGMFAPTSDDERAELLEKCKIQACEIANFINGEKSSIEKVSLSKKGYILNRFVYNALDGFYLKKYALKYFSSGDKCVGCGICERECPTNNIKTLKQNKSIEFGKECSACLRCINICPHNAILFKGNEHNKYEML